jgi:phosphatidylinositol alpha-mannosyltransferase
VLTLGRWLAGRGHTVHYLVANSGRTDIPNLHNLGRFVSTTFNGNTVRTPLPAARSEIRRVLADIQPDVLHVQMPYSPLLAGRVIAAAGPTVRVVGTFHILPVDRWHMAANSALAKMLRATLVRFGAVMAVSEPAAKFAHDVYGVQAQVMPNVVDVAKFTAAQHPRRTDGPVTVAFLGRLVERKGVLQLLRAWQAMPLEVRDEATLVIGGQGPQEVAALTLAGSDRRVKLTGFVNEADKPAWFAAADVACFPSTGGESFGIILVEAMAAGAGVVLGGNNPGYASVLGGQPESLVEPNDTAAFAERLAHFVTDERARRRLHSEQQKVARRYDVETVGPRIEAVYRSVKPANGRVQGRLR